MGYDIWAGGEFEVPADKVSSAVKPLLQAAADKQGYPDIVSLAKEEQPNNSPFSEPWDFLDDMLENATLELCEDGCLNLTFTDDSFRHEDYDQWLFEAIAPFCNPECSIEFNGEDGYKWMWEIQNGKIVEVGSETMFGLDTEAPGLVNKIIDLVYEGGLPVTSGDLSKAELEDILDKIETIIRETGFGPQAGKSELERLADV